MANALLPSKNWHRCDPIKPGQDQRLAPYDERYNDFVDLLTRRIGEAFDIPFDMLTKTPAPSDE